MNIRPILLGAVAALVVLGAAAGCGSEPEPIKIGALLPISGVSGETGQRLLNGVLLALDEINSRGGINGRLIELVIKDTQADPEEAKRVFLEMEEEVQPLVYISGLSRVGVAIGPLAEDAEAPLLVLVATSPKVVDDKEWVFKYPQSAAAEVAPALFHFEKLGVKRLGLLYLNDAFGRSLFESVGDAFRETGGVLEAISYEADKRDFRDSIAELADTDAIYFVGLQPHRRGFLVQLKESDYSGHIIGSSDLSTELGQDGTEGVYMATPGLYNPSNIFAGETSKRYEEAYDEPIDFRAAAGYDGMRIIADLLQGEELTRVNVQRILDSGFTYSGVWGLITVLPREHDMFAPLLPTRIVGGEFEFLR